jgi:hypothetical protein
LLLSDVAAGRAFARVARALLFDAALSRRWILRASAPIELLDLLVAGTLSGRLLDARPVLLLLFVVIASMLHKAMKVAVDVPPDIYLA